MPTDLSIVDPDIRLGFIDSLTSDDRYLLHPSQFPSKIGGKPCWLHPDIPSSDRLKCTLCDEPLDFIMQIYAPVDGCDEAFHRMLYLFGCVSCKSNFKVFRCQLPEKNDFYTIEPPSDDPEIAIEAAKMFDEKFPEIDSKVKSNLTEYFLEVEPEPNSDAESDDDSDSESESDSDEMTEEERKKANELLKKYEASGGVDMDDSEIAMFQKIHDETIHDENKDVVFKAFRKRCSRAPDQVMRYQRNGEPLWFSTKGIPSQSPPLCSNCKGKRTFEFQIQPQMLSEVEGLEELEFAVLAIFTCQKSCESEKNIAGMGLYVEENVYRQRE